MVCDSWKTSLLKSLDRLVPYSETDEKGVIRDVNLPFCQLMGYSREELIGKTHSLFRQPDAPAEFFAALWKAISHGQTWEGVLQNETRVGERVYLRTVITPITDSEDTETITGYLAIRQLIPATEFTEEPSEIGALDPVTNLPMRQQAEEAMEKLLQTAQRYERIAAVALVEIDDLLEVEQLFGDHLRDAVLRHVVDLVRVNFREADWCFRWSGRQLMLLMPETEMGKAAIAMERFRMLLEDHSGPLEGRHVACSVGLVEIGRDEISIYELLTHLTERLDAAQRSGGGRVCF